MIYITLFFRGLNRTFRLNNLVKALPIYFAFYKGIFPLMSALILFSICLITQECLWAQEQQNGNVLPVSFTTKSDGQTIVNSANLPVDPVRKIADPVTVSPEISDVPDSPYKFSGHSLLQYFDGYEQNKTPIEMSQTWLTCQKDLSDDPNKIDWGFQTDAFFGTANGSSYGDNTFDGAWSRSGDKYGFSILNLYGTIGNEKCNLILGKFLTPLGYESFSLANFELCSYTHLTWHEGLTHTGGLLNYKFNDHWSTKLGVAMGDDVGFGNRYGDSQILFNLAWEPSDQLKLSYIGDWGHYHPEHDEKNTARLSLGLDYQNIFGMSAQGETDFYKQTVLVTTKLTDKLSFNTFADYSSLTECQTDRCLYEDFGIGSFLIYEQNKSL